MGILRRLFRKKPKYSEDERALMRKMQPGIPGSRVSPKALGEKPRTPAQKHSDSGMTKADLTHGTSYKEHRKSGFRETRQDSITGIRERKNNFNAADPSLSPQSFGQELLTNP